MIDHTKEVNIEMVKNILKSKKGAGIFEFIIIVAIVAILATTTLPSLNASITEKGVNAINKIDEMESAIEE
jgi:Tfp pilus assembly protein PilE